MKNQVPKKIKDGRFEKLMLLQKKISEQKNKKRLNKIYSAIVEGISEDGLFYFGRSYAEAPEIDVRIYFTSNEPLIEGQIVSVKILNTEEYDMIGAITNETEFA
jgi:ribosomal protein S12 methylthiotransferase